MAYTTPKVEITQTFTLSPATTTQPLPAFIIGPQYDLHRYDVAAEKAGIAAVNPNGTSGAAYDPNDDVVYPYPSQTPGTVVDTSYVQVNIDDAEALYFPNSTLGSTGGGSGNAAMELVQTAAASGKYFSNRLRFTTASTTVAKTGNETSRSSFFGNRDVQVGDVINVTDNLGNTLTSQVNAVLADTVVQDSSLAASIGTKSQATLTDGVANGTPLFTSATANFTNLVGQIITIATKGTYTIVSLNSATSVNLSGSPSSGTGLSYYVGGVSNDIGNIQPQAQVINNAATYVVSSGSNTGVAIDVTGTTAYVGYPALRIANDTYTVTVTTAGTPSAARFSIASSSGAFATQTNVALTSTSSTVGTLTLDTNGGNTVVWAFTLSGGTTTFTINSQWTVALKAAVTLINPAASGTFTGASNINYKLTVTKGGPAYNGSNASTAAQITVTSNNVDASPAVLVGSSAISVGTLGVLATFSGGSQNSQFILGDVYYIPAFAPAPGKYKILQFNDSLPAATLTLSGAAPISCTLSLVQPTVQVPPVADIESGALNYVAGATTLTLNSGIVTTDPNLLNGGLPVPLPIEVGTVYIQHRDLNLTNSTSIQSVSDTADIEAILGTVDPDNTIAQGVYEAVNNAAGQAVYFISLQTNDVTGYNTALAISKATNTVYGTVPLTFDEDIQQAVVGFINAVSTPNLARWRVAWLAGQAEATALLYDLKPDGVTPWTATITDDPVASGTQYTLVTVAGATFITSGIRVGDSVLINFGIDSAGDITYSTYTVSEVRTQTTLVIATGPASAINSPVKVEIQRNYSTSEQVSNLAAVAASYDNRRVRLVFPDYALTGGVRKEGYFIAAAVAGLRSGVVPHQGLTNTPVLGFDTLPEINTVYTSDQLDTLAASGVFIVTQTIANAVPYVRHQLTTNMSSVTYQEDSITSNVDSISYALQKVLTPFIGIYNRNNFTLQLIKDALNAEILYLQTQSYTATAGYQLGPNTSITNIAFDPTFADTINVTIVLDVPGPTNYITVNLVV